MAETLHERFDRDERRLLESASADLWSNELLDALIDVASPVLEGSRWNRVPDGATVRWAERATAAGALAAMALRLSRTIAMTVRCGYSAEALSGMRRLAEAAGHAQKAAEDDSGQYAANWLNGLGRADKPRSAFGADPTTEAVWKLMSGQSHAEFAAFAAFTTTFGDDNVITHRIGPSRDAFWDSVWVWLTARHLGRTLAGVLKVHPSIDQTNFLAVMAKIVAAEDRLERELAERTQSPPASDSA